MKNLYTLLIAAIVILSVSTLAIINYNHANNAAVIFESKTQDGVVLITVVAGRGVNNLSETDEIDIRHTIREVFSQVVFEQQGQADIALQQKLSDLGVNFHTLATWVKHWTCDAAGCTPTELVEDNDKEN